MPFVFLLIVGAGLVALARPARPRSLSPGPTTAAPGRLWAPSTDMPLQPGIRYRWSSPRRTNRSVLELTNEFADTVDDLTVWANTFPADWPADDRDPNRNRFEGVPLLTLPFAPDPVTGVVNVRVWRAVS